MKKLLKKYGMDGRCRYMNPETGSVARGTEWVNDFLTDPECWNGEQDLADLCRVKKIKGEWIAV